VGIVEPFLWLELMV